MGNNKKIILYYIALTMLVMSLGNSFIYLIYTVEEFVATQIMLLIYSIYLIFYTRYNKGDKK